MAAIAYLVRLGLLKMSLFQISHDASIIKFDKAVAFCAKSRITHYNFLRRFFYVIQG
jgi:hypothetical protein